VPKKLKKKKKRKKDTVIIIIIIERIFCGTISAISMLFNVKS
jgi:flagellar basal body-associated protein FliL